MRIALAAVALALTATPALAHGYAGERFFPATILIEDPFVADELAFPTYTHMKGGEEPGVREDEFEFEFAKRITSKFALAIEGAWSHENDAGERVDGFANVAVGAKYQILIDEDAETVLAAALDVELGGTGSSHLDVDDFNTYEPTVLFGKGFGDASNATYLRPLAVTGVLGVAIPEHGDSALVYGATLQYSLPYLHAHVKDVGLGDFMNNVTPLVEMKFETPLDGDERTTGTVNPGLLYSGQSVQIGVEAVIPINRDSGDTVGFTAQLHFYLDDIFPETIGRPLFD